MPDTFRLIRRWYRQIGLFSISLTLMSIIYLWLRPPQYQAQSTALPAPAQLNDKNNVFSLQTQQLYASLGEREDLDKVLATAKLDTIYAPLVDQWHLEEVYRTGNNGDASKQKAIYVLQKKTDVLRSGYGELTVRVKDGDPARAAGLANGIMEGLQGMFQQVQNANNERLLNQAVAEQATTQNTITAMDDSLSANQYGSAGKQIALVRQQALLELVGQYETLIAKYRFLLNAKPDALLVVEKAKIPSLSDKENSWKIVMAVLVGTLLLSILIAALLDKSPSPDHA